MALANSTRSVHSGMTVGTADIDADAIDGTKIADNAIDSEHYTDASIDEEHLTDHILNGSHAAVVADDQVLGGLMVVHIIAIDSSTAGNFDITLTDKTRVLDVWAVHTGGAGEASDTLTITDGTTAITDAMDWSGADKAIVRAGTIDDAAATIAAAGTLRATTTDNDAGTDVGQGFVCVLGVVVT